ncbi:unnamed protein product [Phaeothamnion confervicola]
MAEALLPVVAFDAKWREEEYPAWSKKALNTAGAAPGQARVWKLLSGELQLVALPGDLGAAVISANERNELCREAERQAAASRPTTRRPRCGTASPMRSRKAAPSSGLSSRRTSQNSRARRSSRH